MNEGEQQFRCLDTGDGITASVGTQESYRVIEGLGRRARRGEEGTGSHGDQLTMQVHKHDVPLFRIASSGSQGVSQVRRGDLERGAHRRDLVSSKFEW